MDIKKIILTKKSKTLLKEQNTYQFLVSPKLNKHQIKSSLLEVFPFLKIQKIRTICSKPVVVKKRIGSSKNKFFMGKTTKQKKAFVKLDKDSPKIFEKK